MKKRQIVILAVVFLIIFLIISSLFSGMDAEGKNGKKKKGNSEIEYVKVAHVKNDTIPIEISSFGRVSSGRNVNLTAEVSGKLREGAMVLKQGQDFKKGQLLFRIDDAEHRLSLQSRKSNFLNLIASVLPDLKIDYTDNFAQWQQFFGSLDVMASLPKLPETKSVNEKTFLASRNVLGEYYAIQADEERLKKYNIYAPFNGIYTEVMVEVGTVVNAGSQIARIIQYSSLEVGIPINVNDVQLIHEGAQASIYSEGRKTKWNGKVARIGKNVNSQTQSVDVFIEIDAEEKQNLYEGMYVEGAIDCGAFNNAFELTRKAIFENDKVYVLKDSFLKERNIHILRMNEETAVINGLENNESVVVESIVNPKLGAKVAANIE